MTVNDDGTYPNTNSQAFETEVTIAGAPAPSPAPTAKKAVCFASSETVQLQDGSVKALSEVQLGDMVLTARLDGSTKGFSPVIAVPHAGEAATAATFLQLSTETSDVKMTPDHLVLAGSCAAAAPMALKQARFVSVGDCLQTTEGKAPVSSVQTVQGKGLSSAVTQAGGLIIVNGIAASPFAVSHRIGEAWYVIHRALYAVLPAALGFKLFQQTSEKFGDFAIQFSA